MAALRLDEQGAGGHAELEFTSGKLTLAADLARSGEPYAAWPLSGQLSVDVPDLGFVAPFLAEIDVSRGKINGSIALAGTLQQPSAIGRVELTGGVFRSPVAGIELTDVVLGMVGDAAGIRVDGSLKSGIGSLVLAGQLVENNDPANGWLDVTGENFHLLATREVQLVISPDLHIVAGPREIRVTGSVRVPRAAIAPVTIPSSAVLVSEDVIEPALEASPGTVGNVAGRALVADVKVVLGDDVRFTGFGLKARFAGEARVRQMADQPVAVQGEIRIPEGEYRAYGQGLVIENGRVLFPGGPVSQLGLDIRAVRRPQKGILVGTIVRGTLQKPNFTLFSEPAMSQQEQLSWLVLGRSLEAAPAGERSALAQASLALGVKGSSYLAEHIGKNLGVDEFSIKSGSGEAGAASDAENAALVIGKYLAPNLYLSYGIGLFNAISTLQMQYEFSPLLKLVTESSSESTGADLIYSFERGR